MLICKNFPKLLFSLFLVTLSIHGVTTSRCLWEILYEVGQLLINPSPEQLTFIDSNHILNIWDETEICYPDDVRDQHQKNFGPAPKVLRYTDDSRKKTQVTNVAISTKFKEPKVVNVNTHTPGVTVKYRTNITMKTTEPRQANNEGITYNYYSRLSSETTILICFLATVVAIALYLSFSLYREKKQNRNASNKDSLQSIVSASSGDADDYENELNEILLDDISNLTSTMMVRTYLESLVKELKNSHTKENIKKYITEEFLTMVAERIARDAYMRMNFMESITAESLLRLAHLYHLTGMRQQRNLSSILGIQQEKNINVILKVGKGFEFKTKTELEEVSPETCSTQTDFKEDCTQDGSTQTDVKRESLDDGGISTQTDAKDESPCSSETSSSSTSSSSTTPSSSTTSSSSSSSSSDPKNPTVDSKEK